MNGYMTEQRRELLRFLRSNPDKSFSAKEIAHHISDGAISLSAVYRNLAWLEKSGEISRSTKDGHREIFYSYVASEHCHDCLHLRCEKCGSTVHMDMAVTDKMINDIADKDGFDINRKKTVIYGICSKCK